MWLLDLFKKKENVPSNNQFKNTKDNLPLTDSKECNAYKNIIPPNEKTIHEQSVVNLDTTMGHYPSKTHDYLEMKIVSNTIPPQENYDVLNENEKLFFKAFYNQLRENNLSPSQIKLTRMSSGGFNVDYIGLCYIGKINLYIPPASYAVVKNGNKRATKIFDNRADAECFISDKNDFRIDIRQPHYSSYMQYLRGFFTIKEFSNISVEQCIEYIPYWIRYIKYCKRN